MFATLTYLLRKSLSLLCSLALASFHYRNKRKKQKKTEICSLRSLTCFVIRYAYYTRWRSHLFITEINGKDRKKQKFLPAAGEFNLNDNVNLNQIRRYPYYAR